jgi:hypothetical protein
MLMLSITSLLYISNENRVWTYTFYVRLWLLKNCYRLTDILTSCTINLSGLPLTVNALSLVGLKSVSGRLSVSPLGSHSEFVLYLPGPCPKRSSGFVAFNSRITTATATCRFESNCLTVCCRALQRLGPAVP